MIAPHSNDTTSLWAALAIAPHVNRLAGVVLDAIRAAGERGMTDGEIQAATGLDGNTVRPRRVELERAGLIAACGTRATAAGRQAAVWVAKEQN